MRRPWWHYIMRAIVAVAAIAIVFASGWHSGARVTAGQASLNAAQPVRYKDPSFPFINPLVSVTIPNATGFTELNATKADVQDVIRTARSRGTVQEVGVYFRLPGSAHWFGINEDDKFDPGSLIKVPIMLAYLKTALKSPQILENRYRYDAVAGNDVPNPLPAQLKSGTYSAAELLEAMIVDSDNVAKDILTTHLDDKSLQDVFDETNASFLQDPSGTISPKQYIIMLSRIYSATYLDRYYSNYAMKLLTETSFKDGLVAGLPADVQVGHKYGERGIYEDGALAAIELHDCGLVFAKTPYYLCVMTKGSDVAALSDVIKDISAAVYADRDSFKEVQ